MRLPGDRDGHDRGPPLLRRQQRTARLRCRRVPRVRPRGGERDPAGLARRPPRPRHLHSGRRARLLHADRRRAERGDPGPVRRHDDRPRSRPRRLPADPRPPLAVVEQAGRHLRRGTRPAPSGLPRRGRRQLPRPAVDPHVLQHQQPGQALRQNGAVRPQHGLHARALRRVHGSDARDQRLARRADRARRGAARGPVLDHPGAGGHRLPPPGVRGGHRQGLPVPENARRALAGEPGARPGEPANRSRPWPRSSTPTTRATPSRAR